MPYVKGAKLTGEGEARAKKLAGSGSARKLPGPAQNGPAKGYAKGGAVKMDAGAGSAKGRLEKVKAYGKNKSKGGKC